MVVGGGIKEEGGKVGHACSTEIKTGVQRSQECEGEDR